MEALPPSVLHEGGRQRWLIALRFGLHGARAELRSDQTVDSVPRWERMHHFVT